MGCDKANFGRRGCKPWSFKSFHLPFKSAELPLYWYWKSRGSWLLYFDSFFIILDNLLTICWLVVQRASPQSPCSCFFLRPSALLIQQGESWSDIYSAISETILVGSLSFRGFPPWGTLTSSMLPRVFVHNHLWWKDASIEWYIIEWYISEI